MDAIKQWAFAICATMVACGLAQMILPKSSMEKMFKLIVSIFFLCCLLTPFVLRAPELIIDIDIEPPLQVEERAQRLTEAAMEQTEQTIRSSLSRIIADNLAQKGINHHAITINIKTNGQNEAEVETVEIILDREHENDHNAIASELERELGLDVRLGYE